MSDPDAAIRAEWSQWVRHYVSGSETQIAAAIEAAISGAVRGLTPEQIVAAARRAAIQVNAPAETVVRTETSAGATITGRVTSLQRSRTQKAVRRGTIIREVVTFQLVDYRPKGQPLPAIEVELVGTGFKGEITEGDLIRINAKDVPRGWRTGRVLRVASVHNLRTASELKARGHSPFVRAFILLVAVFCLGAVVVVVYAALHFDFH
jgi:hypothetical protein